LWTTLSLPFDRFGDPEAAGSAAVALAADEGLLVEATALLDLPVGVTLPNNIFQERLSASDSS